MLVKTPETAHNDSGSKNQNATTVQLNKYVVIADDFSHAWNILTNEWILVPSEIRQRLACIAKGPTNLTEQDMPLLKSGVLRLSPHSSMEETIVNARIREFLDSRGALCIMPTEQCNFRCTYCYETFEKPGMTEAVIQGVISFLRNATQEVPTYSLAFFGGEPFLRPDIMERIALSYRELQRAYNFNGTIAITTNGSLATPKSLSRLEQCNIDLYHISVDGPRELHNKFRRSLSMKGTYDQTLENIEGILRTTNARVIFRVNVDTRMSEQSSLVSDWLNTNILPRFQSYAHRIQYNVVSTWDASPYGVEGICISDVQRLQVWLDIQKSVQLDMNTSLLQARLARSSRFGELACYAGIPRHYIVGADGLIYKCSVAFKSKHNTIGKIHGPDRIDLDHEKELTWTSINSLTDDNCKRCSFAPTCMGIHCPLMRIQNSLPPCPTEKRYAHHIIHSVVQNATHE